jgi:hypothetical protein
VAGLEQAVQQNQMRPVNLRFLSKLRHKDVDLNSNAAANRNYTH